ncbi:cytochrome b5 [Tasmannia lanceolata]|uniref:cytochrome b5 n=1 Tax=Tasmannia lanceolata TaxID=3420 RepID=UPI0040627CB6
MPTITKLFSLQEASEHNTKEDCWVVIDGKVYDVTTYLDEHPGGDDVLLTATGKDATDDFEDAGHSKDARELMKDFCIGELDLSPVIPELEISGKKQTVGTANKVLPKALDYWVFPVAIISVSVIAGLFYLRKK